MFIYFRGSVLFKDLNRKRMISVDHKPTGIPFLRSYTTTIQPQKVRLLKNLLRERETALNTHRLQRVVSHNTILSANELIDFVSIIVLFFCSLTDKTMKSKATIFQTTNSQN